MDTALRIALSFVPEGVALIVGLVLAVLRRRSDRELAALAAAGFALHFVAVVLGTVSVYASTGIRTAADLARYSALGGVLGLVVIFARLLGWILLLLAIFRRLPRAASSSQDNTPTGRHALLDAQGGQVVAEEGQSLYPEDEDEREPETTGLVGAGALGGAVGAGAVGAGALGARGFGEGPFGDRSQDQTTQLHETTQLHQTGGTRGPAGSDAPTEAVPIGRIPLRSRMPEPVTAAAPDLPADPATGAPEDDRPDEVAEEDVHDPVEDELRDAPAGGAKAGGDEGDEVVPVDELDDTEVEDADEAGAADADIEDALGHEAGGDEGDGDEDVDADGDVVVDEAPETADEPGAGVEGPEEQPAATVLTPVAATTATTAATGRGTAPTSPATERPPLPELTSTPVLRTDFSDEDAWEVARTAIVGPDDVEAPTNLEVVADPDYTDLTAAEAAELATTGEAGTAGGHPCVFLVDATTIAEAGSPVLVVDLREDAGRSFRCAASEVQTLETILSTTRTSFADLAAAVADDGVFRGV